MLGIWMKAAGDQGPRVTVPAEPVQERQQRQMTLVRVAAVAGDGAVVGICEPAAVS
jgi:hypothetical protein